MDNEKFSIEKAKSSDTKYLARFQVSMALETEELELAPDVVLSGAK